MRLVIINIFLIATCAGQFNKVIKLDRYEICEKPQSSPFKWGEIYLDNTNGYTLINSELEVLRDVRKVKLIMHMTRCSSRELLDSCQNFVSLKAQDGCLLFAQPDGSIFYKYSTSFKPHYRCPFMKGHYVQVNGSLDPKQFQLFPLEKWYWRMQAQIFDYYTNEYMFKVCVEGQAAFSRQ